MIIQILVDNPNSWMVPYANKLMDHVISKFGFTVSLLFTHDKVVKGDILFLLSCEKIFKKLHYNKHNLVVHESDLPKGKGWSPVTWQVLESKNKIPVTLFEANDKVDSGVIYGQNFIELNGNELLPEIKKLQGERTIELVLSYLENYPVIGKEQIGNESFYSRRTSVDSELDINKTIKEQFNLLRVCDNERYPAFFTIGNQKYTLKIHKENE